MKLKDLVAMGLTQARAEIISRATECDGKVIVLGVPIQLLNNLIRHGFAEYVRKADPATQQALQEIRDGCIATARADLLKEPPEWKHALSCLSGAAGHERDATRTILKLTPKGHAFAKAWQEERR